MKKRGSKLIATLMCLPLALCALAGCGNKVSNDAQTLEIYVASYGYGYQWLDAIIELFKEEQWVKEKYPNLNIPRPKNNSERSYAVDQVKSGNTTIDLLFSTASGASSFEKATDSGGNSFFTELSDIYESTVIGEEVLYKDKMDENFLEMSTFTRLDGSKAFYSVPWVSGMQGLLYNKTVFGMHTDWTLPNTTDELKALCDKIVAEGEVPFVFSSKEGYWTCMMFLLWWSQYEGVDAYNHFYQGQVKDGDNWMYSKDVFTQTGRLRALETMESLLSYKDATSRKYIHDNVNTDDFSQAQAKFMLRQGMMQPNGDWFETEMRDLQAEGATDVITFMKTPVISSIVEKCPSVGTDAELSAVVAAVDRGETALSGTGYEVTQTDFDKISEARRTILPVGNHQAFIPSYATAKDVAKDFLKYLATDKACNAFIRATHGANMPFSYDCETKDPALFGSLAQIQRDRLGMIDTGIYLMNENTFRTVYYGGIARASVTSLEMSFTARTAADQRSARKIFDDEVTRWTDSRWDSMLINSGLK